MLIFTLNGMQPDISVFYTLLPCSYRISAIVLSMGIVLLPDLIISIQVWTQKSAVQKASVDVNISYH
jgi:hypothetical protein